MIIGIRCEYCGKFCSAGMVYQNYGRPTDEEPPDETFICQKCYEFPGRAALIKVTAWIGPNPFDTRSYEIPKD